MTDLNFSLQDTLIFDWDGTIVNSVSLIRAAHNHVRALYRLGPWSDDDFHKNQHMSSRDLYPKLYGPNSDTAITQLYDYIDNNALEQMELMPGALELIEFLRAHNKSSSVISNKRHPNLLKEITNLKLDDVFPYAVGADHAEKDKPDRAPFDVLVSNMGEHLNKDKQIWYVGDTETDLKFANAIEAQSIFISNERHAGLLIEDYKPELSFLDCHSFVKFLKSRVAVD